MASVFYAGHQRIYQQSVAERSARCVVLCSCRRFDNANTAREPLFAGFAHIRLHCLFPHRHFNLRLYVLLWLILARTAAVGCICTPHSAEEVAAIALGGVAVALSMGIYQSYFPLTAALLVFSMLVDVIDSRFSSFKEFITVGLKYIAGLAFGMILYFVILRICLKVNNVELIDYQGISSMGIVTFSQLIDRISAAYKNFFYFYRSAVFHSFFKYIAAAAFLFSAVAALAIIFQRRLYKSFSAIIEIIILVALIPLACDLVYVMAGEFTVHLVMVYPMLLPLIFPAVISERICFSGILKSRSGFVSLALTLALLLTQLACAYEFVLIDNRAYFYMDMTYKNVYAFMTKLTAKIELQDDFSSSTPVALIGKINMDSNVPATPGMTGVFTGNSVANIYTRKHLLYNVLASRYDYVDADTEEQIKQTDEFEEMPCYPNAGSIKTINGVIVVKFSD